MKKLWIMVLGLMIIGTAQASLILTEHFGQATETLATNDNVMGGDIASSGWTNVNGSGQIYMNAGDLTYTDYKSVTDNTGSAEYKATFGKKVATPIGSHNSGSLYVAAIMNITACTPASTPGRDYLWAFGNGTASMSTGGNHFGRLCAQKSTNTFQLGVSKNAESAAFLAYTDELAYGTYLVVMEYKFVDGEKNDIVYLYLNPTKGDKPAPTLEIYQSYINPNTGSDVGSGTKADPTKLESFLFYSTSTTKLATTIDELKIATDWMDLWESGGGSEPSINLTKTSINYSDAYTGEFKAESFTLKAENLTEGVTISHANSEISLSASTLTKAQAEAGANVTVTLTPGMAGECRDTIVISSSGVVKKIPLSWYTYVVSEHATLASLRAAAEAGEEYGTFLRFTGEAIVTRDTTIGSLHQLFLQDESAAIKVEDDLDTWIGNVTKGDKLTSFRVINKSTEFGIHPVMPLTLPTIVSHNNEIVPEVVTLEQLQANPREYLLEIVRVEDVVFSSTGTFAAGDFQFAQGDKNATLKVEMGIGLTGKEIPALANVIGFSFNTSGSVIVPRNFFDVEDATPQPLLENAGFEEYTTTTFMGQLSVEYAPWYGINGLYLTTEGSDVIEGVNALKTTTDMTRNSTLTQEIDVSEFLAGDEFELRVCYKILTDKGDGTITLNSFWNHPVSGQMSDDAAILYGVALDNSSVWDTVTVRTHKPSGATKFYFQVTIKARAIVLLDNFAFEYVEPEEYFSVTPEYVKSVQTNINETVTVETFTVKQKGLSQPVMIEITGTDAAMFSADKTQVTADGEQVTVTYHPTAVGHHEAYITFVDDESPTSTLSNCVRGLHGTAIDPTQKPTITINPTSLPNFSCAGNTWMYETISVTSTNCIGDVYCHVTHEVGSAFVLLEYALPRNMTSESTVQFYPLEAGDYRSRLWWTTEGGDTVEMVVTGTGTAPVPPVVDYDTVFNWNATNPLNLLNENFAGASAYRNKTYQVPDGWQNVVTQGKKSYRAWWGYIDEGEEVAKATAYKSGVGVTSDTLEMWLVTPALNFNTPNVKQFGFKVKGEFLHENQISRLEAWFIDPVNGSWSHITPIDELIPANDSKLSGDWVPVTFDLTGMPLPNIFCIGFRFAGHLSSDCPETYYVDDVTWGVEVITGIEDVIQHNESASPRIILHEGRVVIIRDGKVYGIDGQRIR